MAAKSRKTPGRGRPSVEDVLDRLDQEVSLLHEHLGGLPRAVEADQILREIWIDDVHNSTAIEGNTMTRAQVENVVERRTVQAELTETLDVEGYAEAADWVYRMAPDYTGVPSGVVSEIHRRVVQLAWHVDPPATHDDPGAWRQTDVRVGRVRVSLPPAIPADLDDWSRSTSKLKGHHPIVHAAIHHAWLERIHPFADGNGRVGRLVLNFMLIQQGYPPAVILKEARGAYLRGLRTADAGNPGPLAEVIARSVSGALARFLIPKLAGKAKLVPLSALAADGPYSAAYLRQLALKGRLRVVREGQLYLSSRAWLNEYIENRDPRGGQPGARAPSQATS
jgi:fido (protein-threonine AMPylation protein)